MLCRQGPGDAPAPLRLTTHASDCPLAETATSWDCPLAQTATSRDEDSDKDEDAEDEERGPLAETAGPLAETATFWDDEAATCSLDNSLLGTLTLATNGVCGGDACTMASQSESEQCKSHACAISLQDLARMTGKCSRSGSGMLSDRIQLRRQPSWRADFVFM